MNVHKLPEIPAEDPGGVRPVPQHGLGVAGEGCLADQLLSEKKGKEQGARSKEQGARSKEQGARSKEQESFHTWYLGSPRAVFLSDPVGEVGLLVVVLGAHHVQYDVRSVSWMQR